MAETDVAAGSDAIDLSSSPAENPIDEPSNLENEDD